MPRLFIKCPFTGRFADTGLAMDRPTFAGMDLEHNALDCPHCGQLHLWGKANVRFEDELSARLGGEELAVRIAE